jgi:sulfur-oxidizing protein SoxY
MMTRRQFLKAAALLGFGGALLPLLKFPETASAQTPQYEFFNAIKDAKNPTDLEKQHQIDIRLPVIAEDGANVPIVVSMNHPMEKDHYIQSIQILNFNDPIVGKGMFKFTPANGQAYISTQMRMDGGDPDVFVVCECNKHGKWVASKRLKVSLGGC